MRNVVLGGLFATTASLAAHGSAQGASAGLQSVARDSAGVTIVENERPAADTRLGWRIGPEPTLSIGAVEGDPAYELFRVSDATRLPDGRIVVANAGSAELRTFDETGTHLGTWGGEGEGPGEFGRGGPSGVGRWPGDSISASDTFARRFSVFDANGEHGRTSSLPDPYWRLIGVLPDGKLFVGTVSSFRPPDGEFPDGVARIELEYGLVEADGSAHSTLGTHPGAEWSANAENMSVRPHPFSRSPVYAVWGGLVVIGANDRYDIRAYATDGRLTRIVRRDHDARRPTRADLDAYHARRYESLSGEERSAALGAVADMALTEAFPAFNTIRVDGLEYLWVEEYREPGETGRVWTVFDPEGRVLGFLETPPGLRVFEIGADYILGAAYDEFQIEYVQLWPLDRAGS
ncbi:hypothetical protein [Candidatus Palauibacter sp.]|uniref:hypothetical protein n=1 Tax=Candidatus Palauibacter sp. TaxID=3101350 RepID=UPI003B52984C